RLIRREYDLKVQSFIGRKLLRSRVNGSDESCATLFLLKEQQTVLRRWRRIRDRKTPTFAKQCIERDGLGGWRCAFQPRDTGKSRDRLGDISGCRILRQPAAQCGGEPIGVQRTTLPHHSCINRLVERRRTGNRRRHTPS